VSDVHLCLSPNGDVGSNDQIESAGMLTEEAAITVRIQSIRQSDIGV
jgi:hypothetical protein